MTAVHRRRQGKGKKQTKKNEYSPTREKITESCSTPRTFLMSPKSPSWGKTINSFLCSSKPWVAHLPGNLPQMKVYSWGENFSCCSNSCGRSHMLELGQLSPQQLPPTLLPGKIPTNLKQRHQFQKECGLNPRRRGGGPWKWWAQKSLCRGHTSFTEHQDTKVRTL